MTRKIFLAVAMFILALLAFAKTDSGSAAKTAPEAPATATADSITAPDAKTDTALAVITVPEVTAADDREPYFVMIEGERYILSEGKAYACDMLLESLDSYPPVITEERFFDETDTVSALAICFIVPCVTILGALALLLVFFMKKTRARNSIIERAIDANYTLPDAFYNNGGQSQPMPDATVYENCDTEEGKKHMTGAQGNTTFQRDPKSFSSAVTLLAVGFALILFFGINGKWSVGILAGGVPFFLGLGKLFGYYFIPGFTAGNKNKGGYQRPYYGNGGYNAPYNPGNSTNGRYPGAYPPPFNPGERHDRPMNPRQ